MTTQNQSGKTLTIILLSIAVLVLGVGVAYYATDGFGRDTPDEESAAESKNNEPNQQPDEHDADEKGEKQSATGKDTFDIVNRAVSGAASAQCRADTIVEGKYSIATMYIKDRDHYRMEVRSDMGTVNTIVLNQDKNYTWLEGDTTGTEITLGPRDKNAEEQWQQYVDDAKKAPGQSEPPRISCEQTPVDDNLFVVPNDVTFSNVSPYSVN